MTRPPAGDRDRGQGPGGRDFWLLAATFLVAVAGLIYELIAGTLSTYLLGDSIRQFSYVIGIFLASMGLGGSRSPAFVQDALIGFIRAQIALGLIGGFLAPAIYFGYAALSDVTLPLYGGLVAVGALSGMEIPLIARILNEIGAPEFRFENVLTVDYLGALLASLAFPLLARPASGTDDRKPRLRLPQPRRRRLHHGPVPRRRTATAVDRLGPRPRPRPRSGWSPPERLVRLTETWLFEDDVILSEDSPYQHITLTRFRDRTQAVPRLFDPVRQLRRVPISRAAGTSGDELRAVPGAGC